MTKDEKFQIGMALNHIAMSLGDEDFQKVKGYLKQIEKIVAEQTEPRDLAQDLATGKESILSLAIKGKMERKQKRQTEPTCSKMEIVEQTEPKSCDNCEYEDLGSSEGACDTCENVKGGPTNWTPKQTEPKQGTDCTEVEPTAEDCSMVDCKYYRNPDYSRCMKCKLQTESTGSPIGDYRDGVGAWQTDCPWK